MQRIRTGQSDGVIVAKLDRFARTLIGALGILEEFERHGAVLISVAENLDLSTPMGKAFLRILLVFAELERDRISENWGTATGNAIARGVHIAKFTPAGYDRGPDKRLVPSTDAPAIREAFLMRAAHNTRTEIARTLDESAPRPGGGRWTASGVERIIKNRVYMGEAYRGSAVNPNAHEAIVSFAEWQKAKSGASTHLSPRQEAQPPRRGRSLCGLSLRACASTLRLRSAATPAASTAAASDIGPASAQNPRTSPETQARPFRRGRLARADGKPGPPFKHDSDALRAAPQSSKPQKRS